MISIFLIVLLFGLILSIQLISTQRSIRTDDELKAAVPMSQPLEDLDGLKIITDILSSHTTRPLISGYQEFTLVFKDITCKFQILMIERYGEQHYKYSAGAFSGVSGIEEGVKLTTKGCAIFSCTRYSIDTCGKRFIPYTENSTAIFEELVIECTISTSLMNPKIKAYNSSFYPSTLDVSFLPLELENFDYFMEENDNNTIHSLSLKNPEVELYTFALWGKLFERDGGNLTTLLEDIKEREDTGERDDYGTGNFKICDDEKEETQEDNDEGMVQNLKTFENL